MDISVVVSTHNRIDLLSGLLKALEVQTLGKERFEVIVVDDGCTDGTAAFLDSFKATTSFRLVIAKTNDVGVTGARNEGCRHVSSSIIAFTDDDCIPEPTWLQRGLAYFSSVDILGVEGAILPLIHVEGSDSRDSAPYLVASARIILGRTANVMYRTNVVVDEKMFDPRFTLPSKKSNREDTDLAWRIQQHGRVVFAQDVQVRHPPRYVSPLDRVRYCRYRQLDARLLRKHPERFRDILGLTLPPSPIAMLNALYFMKGIVFPNQ